MSLLVTRVGRKYYKLEKILFSSFKFRLRPYLEFEIWTESNVYRNNQQVLVYLLPISLGMFVLQVG